MIKSKNESNDFEGTPKIRQAVREYAQSHNNKKMVHYLDNPTKYTKIKTLLVSLDLFKLSNAPQSPGHAGHTSENTSNNTNALQHTSRTTDPTIRPVLRLIAQYCHPRVVS